MRKWQTILLAASMATISGHATSLLSEDFETYSPAEKPVATRVSAVAYTATGENFITTAGSLTNTAGSGIGVHIRDNDASSTALEWEYGAGNSAIKASFDFSRVSFIADANKAIRFGLGQAGATLGSSSRRYTEAAVYDNGSVRVRYDGSTVTAGSVGIGTSHNITMFANDSNTNSLTYTGPDDNSYILPTNSVAWWFDGALVLNSGEQHGLLDVGEAAGGGTIGDTEGNLNRIGFVTSSTSDINLDYVFDNIMASSLSVGPAPEYLVDDDFESDEPDSLPSKPVEVRPESIPAATNLQVLVVGGTTNTIGTGNGLRIIDDINASGQATRLEYTFPTLSAVRADLVFRSGNDGGSSDEHITVALGEAGQSLTSSSRRWTDCRLYADGTIDYRSSTGSDNNGNTITTSNNYALSIFANDYDDVSIEYVGPDDTTNSLAANSVAYWLNGSLRHITDLQNDKVPLQGGTIATTTNNFSKFGLVTDSGAFGIDFVIDDVKISSIEPDTGGTPPPPPEYLFEEYFEAGQTVGSAPTGASQYRPSPAGTNVYVQIVDDGVNVAGAGNGLQIFDNAPAEDDPDVTNLEYNFVGNAGDQVSALRVDFAFSALSSSGPGEDYIAVGLGEYDPNRTFQTTANRYIDVRLYDDGTIDFETADTNVNGVADIPLLAGANTLTVFANDYDAQSVDYTGLDNSIYSLPANSAAYWLNGSLVLMSNDIPHLELDLDNVTTGGTVADTEDNFGKFGFNTGTSDINLNYVIDNIKITTNILNIVQSYSDWIELYPGLGSDTNLTDDAELDGLDNLTEMALGGDPTVDDAASILPVISIVEEDGSTWFNYVYMRRVFRDDIGLTYEVLSSDNLVIDPIDNPTEEAGFEQVDYEWESVTNRVPVDAKDVQFMNLEIEIID